MGQGGCDSIDWLIARHIARDVATIATKLSQRVQVRGVEVSGQDTSCARGVDLIYFACRDVSPHTRWTAAARASASGL